MVLIYKEDRDDLKFVFWGRTYKFNCLPFGLACAPWVFTKNTETSSCTIETNGRATDRLHR